MVGPFWKCRCVAFEDDRDLECPVAQALSRLPLGSTATRLREDQRQSPVYLPREYNLFSFTVKRGGRPRWEP